MPRSPNITRKVKLGVWLSEECRARLDLHLYSTAEGRIPFAAHSIFVERAVNDLLDRVQSPGVPNVQS